jgi:signal transduction histidine kinase
MLVILDVLFAGAYWVLGQITANSQMAPRPINIVVVSIVAVSVAICRSRVSLGYVIALVGQAVALIFQLNTQENGSSWVTFITVPPMAYALFWLSARHSLRWAVVGWLPTLAFPIATIASSRDLGPVFLIPLLLTPMLLIGYAEYHRHKDVVAYHTGLADRERDRSRLALAEERIRIARELHDLISHGMSVITVQAGSGRLVIDDRPREVADILESIETTSRQMLGEMRQMLGVLRADDHPLPTSPTPDLSALEQLVAQTDQAGVRVELIVAEPVSEVPPGIGLAAYRIVQEALANVVRHARTDTCQVRIGYAPDSVSLEILDRGRGCPGCPEGLGLTGMRERAHSCGGHLDARSPAEGGFRVTARLPFPEVPPGPVTARTPSIEPSPALQPDLPTASVPETGSSPETAPDAAEEPARPWSPDRSRIPDRSQQPPTLVMRLVAGLGLDRRRFRSLAPTVSLLGSGALILLGLTGTAWINYDMKNQCQEAKSTYGGDCVSALLDLIDDPHQSYRSRNYAINNVSHFEDPRTLPLLRSYYTGVIPPREPLDDGISQYELRKAIRILEGESEVPFFLWIHNVE